MKIGIASLPSVGSGRAYPGRLIEIEERRAEVQERAEDEQREKRRHAPGGLPLAVQERTHHAGRELDDEQQGAERAERMDEVGGRQPPAAAEGRAGTAPLAHEDGDGEAPEGEPGEARENEGPEQDRRGESDSASWIA
jgi:hypothetical protein